MRKKIMAVALFALTLAASVVASDDPFTGTWREMPEGGQLILTHTDDGFFVQMDERDRTFHKWGEDFLMDDGYTINF